MAESQRIEDLRKRYHENPRRFFAPLANEYRKSGFLDRSLLLCEKHLAEQPDNLNGLVVYGQTLFESKRESEAKKPFEMALGLDPENLIALRHLGDISRLEGDVDTAKKWYEKVLELDRRNDEVLDILQSLSGGEPAAPAAPSGTGSIPLVTVASSVSVSGGGDPSAIGMVNLDAPSTPPGPPSAKVKPKSTGPGKTVVIDAAALAAADLKRAQTAAAPTKEVEAVKAPAPPPISTMPTIEIEPPAAAAPPRPSKRASLLDISFDFSETPAEEAPLVTPAAPVLGNEAAEYGFVDSGVPPVAESATPTATDSLIVDHSHSGDALSAPMAGGLAGLETTDMGGGAAGVSPMAGLEASEFQTAEAAPMAGLESSEIEPPSVAPVSGLSRADEVDLPAAPPPPPADLPTLEIAAVKPVAPTAAVPSMSVSDPIDLDIPESSAPLPFIEEPPSARPKPRMTKADMSSLPLLADFGLEDDEPTTTPIAPPPIIEAPSAKPPEDARKPQKTPAFVTETMATLYVKQGYKQQAIEVYRQLIEQDPSDAGLRERLAALEAEDATGLEFEAPSAGTPEPTPAPANAALSDVSFAGVGLNTPAASAPKLDIPAAAGPSAREFFGGFARRAAAAAVATAATASVAAATPATAAAEPAPAAAVSTSGWPLDALFGAASDVSDLHAAEVLAGVATFAGPSGGTGLDTLFSAEGGGAKPTVQRASQTLKFDQFFASGAPAAAASGEPQAPPAAGGDDDLDKFQGWLKGLKPQ